MEANDMAAMREALVIAKKAICNHARANHTCDSLAWENSTINANCGDILCGHRDLCEAKTAIQKAISKPPRNCDVGTADEQYKRHCAYCKKNKDFSCAPVMCRKCYADWTQTPYVEEDSDGEK